MKNYRCIRNEIERALLFLIITFSCGIVQSVNAQTVPKKVPMARASRYSYLPSGYSQVGSTIKPLSVNNNEIRKSWRISDRTDIDVDFHSINEAMADSRVQDGHTLYVERKSNLEGGNVTKAVTIIGPGYSFNDNSRSSTVGTLRVQAAGVKIIGLTLEELQVYENNASIEHCKIHKIEATDTDYENDNCKIHSCFITDHLQGRGEDGTFDWIFTNNIITSGISSFDSGVFCHNTILSGEAEYSAENITYSTLTNNVLWSDISIAGIDDALTNKMDKNIVSVGTYDDCKVCETLSKIISCKESDYAEDYYLPVGYSLGYSTDGTDCGAYGGESPYTKGGVSGLFVERDDEPSEPEYPSSPVAKGTLDKLATLDIANDVYNSLEELLKALSVRNATSGAIINAADQTFELTLDEALYTKIQPCAIQFETSHAYIYIQAQQSAVFNITLSPAFMAAHINDMETVIATVSTLVNHFITTNITILINGKHYSYNGFMVEPNDLLNLKNVYTYLNGENWTGGKWSFLSNGRLKSDFPGVTFTEADKTTGYSHVQEICLDKKNLKGYVTNLRLYFPKLTALSLYGNQLSGDITTMVSELSSLKNLNISYNLLTGLTSLPPSVTTLSKGGQLQGATTEFLEALAPTRFFISQKQSVSLPTILTYDLSTNSNVSSMMYYIIERGDKLSNSYATLQPLSFTSSLYETVWGSPYVYEYAQEHPVYLRTSDNSIYPAIIQYEDGDANMSGYVDLLDVQTTIVDVLNPANISLFNKSAANTYADETINVQDVVCTVNIVLDNKSSKTIQSFDGKAKNMASRQKAAATEADGNTLFVEGEHLWLSNAVGVAAIEVNLDGVSSDEVSLKLNRKDFQIASRNTDEGSRHIIYSLSGKSVPAGTTAILRLSHSHALVTAASLASVDAKALGVTIASAPTAIDHLESNGSPTARFEGNAIAVISPRDISNAKVVVTSASGMQLFSATADSLPTGKTTMETNLTSGIYIIGIYENGKRISNAKILKK